MELRIPDKLDRPRGHPWESKAGRRPGRGRTKHQVHRDPAESGEGILNRAVADAARLNLTSSAIRNPLTPKPFFRNRAAIYMQPTPSKDGSPNRNGTLRAGQSAAMDSPARTRRIRAAISRVP